LDIDEEREKVSLTMKDQSNMESKVEHDFKKNKKEDVVCSRDEDDTSSSLKSNITFTKA
jgi:ribosomal protein S1